MDSKYKSDGEGGHDRRPRYQASLINHESCRVTLEMPRELPLGELEEFIDLLFEVFELALDIAPLEGQQRSASSLSLRAEREAIITEVATPDFNHPWPVASALFALRKAASGYIEEDNAGLDSEVESLLEPERVRELLRRIEARYQALIGEAL